MVDIIFTKKTLCILSPKSCLFCGLNLVGLLCCFLGKTLYSHSTSLHPGVKMGAAALPGKPVMKCWGVTLQWTCISSTGLSLCSYLLHAVKTEMGFISWVSQLNYRLETDQHILSASYFYYKGASLFHSYHYYLLFSITVLASNFPYNRQSLFQASYNI